MQEPPASAQGPPERPRERGQEPSGSGQEPLESGAITGIKLIFWLFVVLAFFTAAILLWFIQVSKGQMQADAQTLMATDPAAGMEKQAEIGPVLFRLHAALAGNLSAPVLVWFLLKGIAEPARRTYWFLVAPWAALATFLVVLLLLVATGPSAQG